MAILTIGQPYPSFSHVGSEGCHYSYESSGHWLHYLYSNPSSEEISSLQSGEANFGLYIRGPVLFLLHQFGRMAWNDASYSWWLLSEECRRIPPLADYLHAFLKVVMVDTETGVIKALRALTFSAQFTHCLHKAIVDQIRNPWSKESYEKTILSIYSKYSTMDLVERAEIFCKGGE